MIETALPAVFDDAGNAAVYAATGKFTGRISGVAREDHRDAAH